MRNPSGEERYTGPWSDKSTKWTDAAKKALRHTTTVNDGKFFIPYSVYKTTFVRTFVSFLSNWQRRTTRASWNRTTGTNGFYYAAKFTTTNQ